MLKLDNNESLAAAIESALVAPTIKNLGPRARETLVAIAAFLGGVEEIRVGRMFPGVDGVGEVVKVLCGFYRNGFVRMLSPFQFHFLQQTPLAVCVRKDRRNNDCPIVEEEEYVRCNHARAG